MASCVMDSFICSSDVFWGDFGLDSSKEESLLSHRERRRKRRIRHEMRIGERKMVTQIQQK
jgi:hypothetical protein